MNREAFEASYASSHDLPLETFSQYRMGETYRLPGIASHWRTWLSASRELEKIAADRKACWEEFKVQGRQLDRLKVENEDLRKDAERWRFIRDEWPKVKLVPNGDWFNSCFLEREIDTAMSKKG